MSWDAPHPDVTSYPLCSDRPEATRADIELFLKQCSQTQLETKLRAVQQRLGSPDERPGDLDCAQMIGHQLNNVLTIQRVNEILRQLDELEQPTDARDETDA
jgi:hypothetical protein